jgi:hypothetical protein
MERMSAALVAGRFQNNPMLVNIVLYLGQAKLVVAGGRSTQWTTMKPCTAMGFVPSILYS